MPRKSPATKNVESAPEPAAAAATGTRIVRRRAPKKVAAEKSSPAPAPVEVAAADATTTVTNEPVAEEEVDLVSKFSTTIDSLQATLTEMRTSYTEKLKELEKELKTMKREYTKVLTKATKRKVRRTNPNSGVHKPVPVSAELCAFLKQPADTLMSRVEVNKAIHEYIKSNNLQKPEDGRRFVPDRALRDLLKVPQGEELTYFTMGRYVKHLFPASATA